MPRGITHDKITFVSAPLVGISTYALTNDSISTMIVTGAFVFSGLMFSGDLDLPSRQYFRWGPLRFIWKPYQRMFSHRSIWTHGVLLGTIIRVLYLYLWISAGLLISTVTPFVEGSFLDIQRNIMATLNNHSTTVLHIFVGLLVGAFSHTAADLSVSWVKRKTKILRSR
jgi:uncharacterized metal-binding protein